MLQKSSEQKWQLGASSVHVLFGHRSKIELQKGITNIELSGILKLKKLCGLRISAECVRKEISFFVGSTFDGFRRIANFVET